MMASQCVTSAIQWKNLQKYNRGKKNKFNSAGREGVFNPTPPRRRAGDIHRGLLYQEYVIPQKNEKKERRQNAITQTKAY